VALPATDTVERPEPSGVNATGLLIMLLAGLAAGGFTIRRFRRVPEA
jgi:hypothetical protein